MSIGYVYLLYLLLYLVIAIFLLADKTLNYTIQQLLREVMVLIR
jgi:hypothetical protein